MDKKKFNRNLKKQKAIKRRSGVIASYIITTIIAIMLIGVAAIGSYIKSGLNPVDKSSQEKIVVEIPPGATSTDIGELLQKNNLVKNASIFKYYVKFNNASNMQQGKFTLSPSMSVKEILDELTASNIKEEDIKFVIPEGKNLEEIAKIVESKTGISSEEFIEVSKDEYFLKELQKKYPELITEDIFNNDIRYPLEGYLFPATYGFVSDKLTAQDMITKMVETTYHNVMPIWNEAGGETIKIQGQESKLTIHQFITFASIIEKEASGASEINMAHVASVFLNRLDQHMMLQTDPTVLYAINENKELTLDELQTDSPYNTYKNYGFPVGPIGSPGLVAYQATINPNKLLTDNHVSTNDVYFISYKTGQGKFEFLFTPDYDVHLANSEKYLK